MRAVSQCTIDRISHEMCRGWIAGGPVGNVSTAVILKCGLKAGVEDLRHVDAVDVFESGYQVACVGFADKRFDGHSTDTGDEVL